jgi:hypothetical protein
VLASIGEPVKAISAARLIRGHLEATTSPIPRNDAGFDKTLGEYSAVACYADVTRTGDVETHAIHGCDGRNLKGEDFSDRMLEALSG